VPPFEEHRFKKQWHETITDLETVGSHPPLAYGFQSTNHFGACLICVWRVIFACAIRVYGNSKIQIKEIMFAQHGRPSRLEQ
jgi:hypothetical protein